jgi:hypothetical protein
VCGTFSCDRLDCLCYGGDNDNTCYHVEHAFDQCRATVAHHLERLSQIVRDQFPSVHLAALKDIYLTIRKASVEEYEALKEHIDTANDESHRILASEIAVVATWPSVIDKAATPAAARLAIRGEVASHIEQRETERMMHRKRLQARQSNFICAATIASRVLSMPTLVPADPDLAAMWQNILAVSDEIVTDVIPEDEEVEPREYDTLMDNRRSRETLADLLDTAADALARKRRSRSYFTDYQDDTDSEDDDDDDEQIQRKAAYRHVCRNNPRLRAISKQINLERAYAEGRLKRPVHPAIAACAIAWRKRVPVVAPTPVKGFNGPEPVASRTRSHTRKRAHQDFNHVY